MRNSRAFAIGRTIAILLGVVLLCAPLASATPARGDGWSLSRPHAKKSAKARANSHTSWVQVHVRDLQQESTSRVNGKGNGNGNGNKPGPTFDRAGFSVGGNFQNESDSEITRDLDSMKGAGARWVRIDVNWSVIQAGGPSAYNWAPFDHVASSALGRGFKVLATILYTPSWARPSGGSAETPPANLQDYVNFSRTVATHFAGMGIHTYEIWNEPNNAAFWRPGADVVRYTAMLRGASAAIKSVDPAATIVTGGLSPAPDDGTNISPVTFLRGIYANGGKGSFDAVGHHPYCWPANPGDTQNWSAWYQMYGTSPSLRSVMTDNGESAKQIWATEFGAPTNGPNGSFVDEQTQASMLTRAFQLWASYSWAGPMFWYSQRDNGTTTDTREHFFGVLRWDFSPKPAYTAYKAATGF